MMIRELLLGIMFFIWVKGASGNSVLQVQNTTIKRNVGGRVTLPCSVGNNTNITLQRIEWFKGEKTSENNQPIHKCIWRPNATETQREDFKNLTCLFVEELPSGNFSLSLRLKASHNDTYYCYVGGHLHCIVTIIVLPGEDDSSQKQDNDGLTTALKVGLGVAAALLLLVIILAYCYRKRRMNFCCRRNPNNGVPVQAQPPPQDEESISVAQNQNEEWIQMLENEDQGDPADGNEPAASN